MANRWKGLVLGALGGALGTYVLGKYLVASKGAAEQLNERFAEVNLPDSLDSIAVSGPRYQEGESPTAAAGRIAYHGVMGKDPQTNETKQLLGEVAHWGFGISMGALYGLCHEPESSPIQGGVAFGGMVWLFGNELAAPFLGLSATPSQTPVGTHLNNGLAHMVYGLATSLATTALERAV